MIKSFEHAYYAKVLSETRIFIGASDSCIVDYEGNIIKEYDRMYKATEVYENTLMVYYFADCYLITVNGETIRHYEIGNFANVSYAGEGVYKITYTDANGGKYIRFVDAETDEFIGGKYKETVYYRF